VQTEEPRMFADPALIEAIEDHIHREVGRITCVFHELVADGPHIDIHWVRASRRRPFEALITSGMSALPMRLPAEIGGVAWGEVVALLPAGWPVGEALDDERHGWPLRLLETLARHPHERDTWLGYGHTLCEVGDPPDPFAPGSALNSVILLPPVSLGPGFCHLDAPGGRCIHFMAAVPLYWEELQLVLHEGPEALVDRFEAHAVTDVIDLERRNVARPPDA
jgi:hypothetical protein